MERGIISLRGHKVEVGIEIKDFKVFLHFKKNSYKSVIFKAVNIDFEYESDLDIAKLNNKSEVQEVMCDRYCKYPEQCSDQEELDTHCDSCRISKLIISQEDYMEEQIIMQLKKGFEKRLEFEQENNGDFVTILCIADFYRLLLDLHLSNVISTKSLDSNIEYLKLKFKEYASIL